MKYKYVAVTEAGFKVSGSIESNSEADVITMLRGNNYLPVSVERDVGAEAGIELFSPKVTKKDLAIFCKQFFTMLDAGLSIVRCLEVLASQTENKTLKKAISIVADDVQKGMTLSEAMALQPKVFPRILVNMVEAGEVSGDLDGILGKMAIHFEKDNKIESKVKSSTVYPIALLVVSVCVVVFMVVFVLPTFVGMFEGSGTELPGPTKLLISMSDSIRSRWYVYLGVIGLIVFGVKTLTSSEGGRQVFDGIKLKLPVLNTTTVKVVTSRFTRTLSTLMSSGIPLLKAMEVVSRVVDNSVVEQKIKDSMEDIRRGVTLSRAVKEVGIFPPMVDSMIRIGEESGALDDILVKTADFYDEEVEVALTRMTTLIEPLMIVFMALVIGFIVIAMYLPMFEVVTTI